MSALLHELILNAADRNAARTALRHKEDTFSYGILAEMVERVATGLIAAGLGRQERVGIYLAKRPETVESIFGTTLAAGIFVPINPLLKAEQVSHILTDCNVRILVTTVDRYHDLRPSLEQCHDLRTVILIDAADTTGVDPAHLEIERWANLIQQDTRADLPRIIDTDVAAIFYTSGSTGRPKGVVLSHRNMVIGAQSVAHYLENVQDDRILAVLPFSFDYGFSQLSTAFHTGASVTLMDYLFPKDVLKAVMSGRITGLAGVPPLWIQLAKLPWPSGAIKSLRYITNSGGAMPRSTLDRLRDNLPRTSVFLMYGLTEAFRSTYLPPDELDERPDSIGKAIPNTEVMVARPDGSRCTPGEPGELVHRGPLVSLGYWNDIDKTTERFRPAPGQLAGLVIPEIAVWSGDTVVEDADGYLTFIGRHDEMIKTAGYRVSPTEVEEAVYRTGLAAEAVALGMPDPGIGQAIVIVAVPTAGENADGLDERLLEHCRKTLPNFMVPHRIDWRDRLPRNANGKIDRKKLRDDLMEQDKEARS